MARTHSSKPARKAGTPVGSRGAKTRAPSGPRRIAATEFKARCLELMDQVQQGRQPIVVTKHGKPVARLVPYEEDPEPIFGYLRDTVIEYGDIVSPLDEVWEADAS